MKTETLQVTTPQGNIYVYKWIPQHVTDTTPIILLHDSLGCVNLWRDFPEKLAEACSRVVIAYDRLGYGQSDAKHTLPELAFIEEEATHYFPELKRQLGLGAYVLLGHSVGGGMSITIAAHDKDCKGVITVSAQAFVEELTLQGIEAARIQFAEPAQLDRLRKWHDAKAPWVLSAWVDLWLAPEFRDWTLQPVLERTHCPVLAVHGDKDEYGSNAFPAAIVEHAQGRSEQLILENCGHTPHREKPDELIGAVNQFLGSL